MQLLCKYLSECDKFQVLLLELLEFFKHFWSTESGYIGLTMFVWLLLPLLTTCAMSCSSGESLGPPGHRVIAVRRAHEVWGLGGCENACWEQSLAVGAAVVEQNGLNVLSLLPPSGLSSITLCKSICFILW